MNLNFKVDAEPLTNGVHAVSVVGELDQSTAPELREALDQAMGNGNGAMFIDLSDCEFIDSTGLSLLVETQRRMTDGERRFAVCCPGEDVRRLLELTGIDAALGLYDTRDDALASLNNNHS